MTGQTASLQTENELQRTNHILESNLIDQFNWIQFNSAFFSLTQNMLDYNNIATEGSKQSEYQYIRRSWKEWHVQIFHEVNKIPSISQHSHRVNKCT